MARAKKTGSKTASTSSPPKKAAPRKAPAKRKPAKRRSAPESARSESAGAKPKRRPGGGASEGPFGLLLFGAACVVLCTAIALDSGASRRAALVLGALPSLCVLAAVGARKRSALLARALLFLAVFACLFVAWYQGPVTAQLLAILGLLTCAGLLARGLPRLRRTPRRALPLVLIATLGLAGAGWLVLTGGPKEPLSDLPVRPAVADPIAYLDPTRPGPAFIALTDEDGDEGAWDTLRQRGAWVLARRPATGPTLGTLRLWLPAPGPSSELAQAVDWLTTPLVHRGFAVRVVAWPPGGPAPLGALPDPRSPSLLPADATITVGAAAGWFQEESAHADARSGEGARERALILLGPTNFSEGAARLKTPEARLLLMALGSHDHGLDGEPFWFFKRSFGSDTQAFHRFHRTDWSGLCNPATPHRPWWRARRVLASRRATRRTAVALVMAGLEASLFGDRLAEAFVREPSRAPQLLPALAWRSTVWLADDRALPEESLQGASVSVSAAGWSGTIIRALDYTSGRERLSVSASGPPPAPNEGPVRVRLRLPFSFTAMDPGDHFAVDWIRKPLLDEAPPKRGTEPQPLLTWSLLVAPRDGPLIVGKRRDPAELPIWWVQHRLPCLPFSEHAVRSHSTAHFPLPRGVASEAWTLEFRAHEPFEVELLSPRITRR